MQVMINNPELRNNLFVVSISLKFSEFYCSYKDFIPTYLGFVHLKLCFDAHTSRADFSYKLSPPPNTLEFNLFDEIR